MDLVAVGHAVGGRSWADTHDDHAPYGEVVVQAAAVRRPVLDWEETSPAQGLPVLRASAGAQSRASMICSPAPEWHGRSGCGCRDDNVLVGRRHADRAVAALRAVGRRAAWAGL